MQKIRRLNRKGNMAYKDFFLAKVENESLPFPLEILTDNEYSEELPDAPEIEVKDFMNRYEVGVYLNEKLKKYDFWKIYNDYGLWNWLTLLYFDKVYPSPRGATELVKYFLSSQHRGWWWRNLMRTPWELVYAHGEFAKVALASAINTHSDITEQLAADSHFRPCTAMMEVAQILYYQETKDSEGKIKGKIKRGANPNKPLPGSLRRLKIVADQFALTWDLYSMSANEIIDLLPTDFDKWNLKEKAA